jgi:cystathionine beta-lyase/cystathionine gamma-synthase
MKKKIVNSSRMPVYRDAGFELFDAKTTSDAFIAETGNNREPDHYIYSRYRNPTVVSAEEEIMKLECSKWALLTQSGMSAIDIAFSIFQNGSKTRPWLLFSEIYGGTLSFAQNILRGRRGLDIQSINPVKEKYSIKDLEQSIRTINPELLYIESISNPMLIVPDAESIITIAKKNKVKVIADNTFATPWLWKPLESGADIVIHSATKYFSGHGNLTAGVITGNSPSLLKSAIEYRKFVGHMISADDAYRLQTQVQTFNLRFPRQCSNASMVAEILTKSDKIEKVWYPGLKNHPTHNEALKLFGGKGFGAMVTFDFAGESDGIKRKRRDGFIKAVSDDIKLIPTLGDPHTILMPVESVWGAKYPRPGMIRLSLGFEETGEISGIINNGLASVK